MISFTSVENFFEECTIGIEFVYEGKWYLIEFDDPFSGIGKVRIHLQDEDGCGYLDDNRCEEFENLENLVHKWPALSGQSVCPTSASKLSRLRKPLPGYLFITEP